MQIATTRLVLRSFTEADYEALREIDGDPDVLRYRARGVITEEMTRSFLLDAAVAFNDFGEASFKEQYTYPFALAAGEPERLVGQIGLTRTAQDAAAAYAWYSIHPDFWNQGYATEALQAVLLFGFEHTDLQRIAAECHPNNLASERVMQKSGMKKATCRRTGFDEGWRMVEYLCYEISKAELDLTARNNLDPAKD